MKTLKSPSFYGCVFSGLILSADITFVAWSIQIEPRAFQCWDGPVIDAYWGSIDVHRAAGDKISAGWTWDEIKMWQKIYIGSFFAIWASSSFVSFGLLSRKSMPNNLRQAKS